MGKHGIVCGKGVNDMERGWASESEYNKRVYALWKKILNYCYDETGKYPNYQNHVVCERWLTFSNFVEDIQLIKGYEYWVNNPNLKIETTNNEFNINNSKFIDPFIRPREISNILETWKDIYFEQNGEVWDYRGLYQISNYGRVKSLNFYEEGKEQILRNRINDKGYRYVWLLKDDNWKAITIHQLVAHMFLNDFYFEGAEVDHIIPVRNGGTDHVNNLHWVTHIENMHNEITGNNMRKAHNKDEFELSEEIKEKMKEVFRDIPFNISGRRYVRYTLDDKYIDMGYGYEYRDKGFDDILLIHACVHGAIESYNGYKFKLHPFEIEVLQNKYIRKN